MTENTIDMATLARFAILPGASDLMEAFAAIPPGPMRDAVIHLARTTAGQFTGANGAYPMPDPIQHVGGGSTRPKTLALPSTRTGRPPPGAETPEMQAVQMRMADVPVAEVCEATGLSKQQVYQAVHVARKAGVKFPKTRKVGPIEVGSKVWHTSLDQLSGQGRAAMDRAAALRGISPQEYLDRRQLALELAQAGHGYEAILERTGERDSKVVSAWLSAARGAGHKVPYLTFITEHDVQAEAAAEPPPEPEPAEEAIVEPVVRVFKDVAAMGYVQATGVRKAAERRGMTVGAYQEMRESIVRHRLQGMAPGQIVTATGEARQFVKDTLDAAVARGVTFPTLSGADLEGSDQLSPPELAAPVTVKQA